MIQTAVRVLRPIFLFLHELFAPSKNPFLLMELRREGRNWRTWTSLAGVCFTLSLIIGMGGFILSRSSPGNYFMQRYSPPLGDLFFSIVSLLHLPAIGIAVTKHAQVAFWFEQDKQTLPAIVIAPLTPVELVLMKAAYPCLRGILVFIAGLPVYALCFVMGGAGWLSIAFLLLLVLLLIVQIPPRPVTIMTEHTKRILQRHLRSGSGGTLAGMFMGILAFVPILVSSPIMRRGPVNWLEWLAQALTQGYPFFSFHFPPLLPLILLIVLHKTAQVYWTASFVTTARELIVYRNLQDYWIAMRDRKDDTSTASGYLQKIGVRLWTVAAIIFGIFVVGYAWQPVIVSGFAGGLFGKSGSMPHAMAAFLMALIVPIVWLYSFSPDHLSSDPSVQRRSMRLLHQLLVALGVFVFCCLLARTSPLQTDRTTLARLALVTSTVLLYKFGLHRIEQESLRRTRKPYPDRVLTGLGLVSVLYPVFALWVANPVVNSTAAISPIVAYWNLTPWFAVFIRENGLATQTESFPWWLSPLIQVPFALMCLAIGKWIRHLPERKEKTAKKPSKWFEEWVERFVSQITRVWDNPVTIKEIRVRSRRSGVASFTAALLVFLTILSVGIIWSSESSRIVDVIPHAFFARSLNGISKVGAAILFMLIVASCAISLMFVVGVISLTFTSEIRKATWPGVALTPMQNWEVAIGKIMPALAATVVVMALSSPFLLFCLLIAPDISIVLFTVLGLLWIVVQAFTVACLGVLAEIWYWLLKWLPVFMLFVLLGAHVWFVSTPGTGVVPHVISCIFLLAVESALALVALILVIRRVGTLRTGEIVTEGAVAN